MSVTEAPSGTNEPDILLSQVTEATAGEYEIISELGRGGMAAVYLAKDVSLNRKVAIKTMLPELTARHDMVARFKREAQMAAGLSHPHIVQIHTVKQTKSLVYFVMKFIEGRDLVSIINEHGQLELDITRLILQQAASALSFAHHRGVVHRDIKPANIMVDENGWAVLTDFGIAKLDDGNHLTATGTTVGTPHYMAPEQFHNKELTAAADQYALGIVAYEMLTGKKPFDGSTLAEIITNHLFNAPPDIKQERPDLPPSVSNAIQQMLAKEPEKRFPDLEVAVATFGQPDPAQVDAARGRLMSIARKMTPSRVRLSVPMSPVPAASGATVMTPRPSAPPTPPTIIKPMAPAAPARRRLPWVIAAVVVLVLAVPAYLGAKRVLADRAGPDRDVIAHLQRSRDARGQGDLKTALDEAAAAARLNPNNALALREVGSVLLVRGDNEGARRFFVRSLRANPSDKAAMGWLACSLHRLGDATAASRWSTRAGTGAWSACLQ